MRSFGTFVVVGSLLLAGGCSDDESAPAPAPAEPEAEATDPDEAVTTAANEAFEADTLGFSIDAESADASWTGGGLIALGDGRFRFDLDEASPPPDYEVGTVIGVGGEGFENTVSETTGDHGFIGKDGERCWFNPHAPVGYFKDTITIEEAVRATGAIVESLRDEIAKIAASPEARMFRVELEPSAAEPMDDFRDKPERVWGDRWILNRLGGPIIVGVTEEGALSSLEFEFGPYEPYISEAEIDRVSIVAAFEPADEELVIEEPGCQAIE